MAVTELLARLRKARPSGEHRWVACCPNHDDRAPSLTVRELPDGRVLLHCFAGCDTGAVLDAVGMTFSDLFPEPLTRERLPRIHAPFSPLDALDCLTHESAVVAILAAEIAEAKTVTPKQAERGAVAAGRIAEALEAVHGRARSH